MKFIVNVVLVLIITFFICVNGAIIVGVFLNADAPYILIAFSVIWYIICWAIYFNNARKRRSSKYSSIYGRSESSKSNIKYPLLSMSPLVLGFIMTMFAEDYPVTVVVALVLIALILIPILKGQFNGTISYAEARHKGALILIPLILLFFIILKVAVYYNLDFINWTL